MKNSLQTNKIDGHPDKNWKIETPEGGRAIEISFQQDSDSEQPHL